MGAVAAERIKITPVDTSGFRGGFRIVEEEIPAGVIRDEKKELVDRFGQARTAETDGAEAFKLGRLVTIDYRIENTRGRVVASGPVVYKISYLQPRGANKVDKATVVEIENEPSNDQSTSSPKNGRLSEQERQLVRRAIQDRLLFLAKEIGEAGDLNVDKLRDEAEGLERKLLKL